MLKNLCSFEFINEKNECRIQCNNDAPIDFLKECMFQFQKYLGKIEDEAKAKQEANKPVDPEPVAEDNE